MQFTIASRLRPFSHRPGATSLIPGSTLAVQAFPSCLKFMDMTGPHARQVAVLNWQLSGPVEDFTVILDLERACVRIWGRAKEGYFRCRIAVLGDGESLALVWERTPEKGISCDFSGELQWGKASQGGQKLHPVSDMIKEKDLVLVYREPRVPFPVLLEHPKVPRLSLGSHKAQDWDLVSRRLDLRELLPVWHRLGGYIQAEKAALPQGTFSLLERFEESVNQRDCLVVNRRLLDLFRAGFQGILTPNAEDVDQLGYDLPALELDFSSSALGLLTGSAALIERLFITSTADRLDLLPCLSPEFHCGRMLAIRTPWGEVDFEWTKKQLRRVIIRAQEDREVDLGISKDLTSFRLRRNGKDKGARLERGRTLKLAAGQHYLLDCFQR